MSDERENALGKIRRLLKLGTSSNEHEARLAMAKAAEIALRSSIDLGSVKTNEERARIAETTFSSRAAFDYVEKAAMQICMALFQVKAYFTDDTASYFGLSHNVDAAQTAHAFVIEQCGRDLERFKAGRYIERGRRASKSAITYYCDGWRLGVVCRYRDEIAAIEPEAELENSKTAIILRDQAKEVDAAFKAAHGKIPVEKRERRRLDSDAIRSGLRDGQEFSLRSPIEREAPTFALEG